MRGARPTPGDGRSLRRLGARALTKEQQAPLGCKPLVSLEMQAESIESKLLSTSSPVSVIVTLFEKLEHLAR